MAKQDGVNLKILLATVAIENLTDCSLSINGTVVECTNKDSGQFRDILMGTKSWTISGTAYIDYEATEGIDEALTGMLTVPQATVAVEYTTGTAGDTVLSGSAYFATLDQTATLDAAMEYTFTLEGTGVLSQATEV